MQRQIEQIISSRFGVETGVVLTRPEPQFGDFATNVALQLAKPLGKNPRQIAEEIAESLRESGEFSEVSVAGPGFINLRVGDQALVESARREIERVRLGQRVVIETNNPNPFKALHIGHAFNAIIADTMANLLEVDGADVHRVSYHGDVGAHVGKSMYSLLKFVDGDIGRLEQIAPEDRNTFMSQMYAEGAKAYREDEVAREEIVQLARQSFVLNDELYRQVYTICKRWSFDEIDRVMRRIGNQPIEKRYLESQADIKGVPIVQTNVPGVFRKSEGALIFPGSQYGSFDNAFVTSQGLGLYGARDLGLMMLKHDDFQADKSYIVTAEEQRDYFKGVIKAAELCLPELKDVTVNISTGTVKLTTGKMSSRDGDVVQINWLFDQVAEAIRSRGGEPNPDVVSGALRYQFLRVRVGSDVVFDVNDAVSLTGNSGPYLQYAHARASSILRKATVEASQELGGLDESERALMVKLGQYAEIVEVSARELMPHHLCVYLYELAQQFNQFYEKSRIIGDDREALRLGVVEIYRDTLASGLKVLGIIAPDEL
ncbi:arginine--tRNA ligase [Candidatus Saccharibacteria bacterium 32-49-12]|nr:MAG: arginine--tRNA ligase [Candidatus Saccharibacteria bacterium 32-49-12]